MKILTLLASLISPITFAADYSQVVIQTQAVAGNIHMLMGAGGNIGVSSGKDGIYIIDDQFSDLNEKISKALKKISDSPVRFVINTHWHGDHTGGNELFGKSGSVIIAHDNVRKRMSIENFNKNLDRKTPPAPEGALPVITFPDRMTLHLNGEEAQIIHFRNGHTDGDAIVQFKKSNVIHTGDLFVNNAYPFIDVDSGGSFKGLIEAIRGIVKLANKDTQIIPGHGPLGSLNDLKAYLQMLETVQKTLMALAKKKMSPDQVVAAKPTAAWDAKWGGGWMKPDVFTRIAYRSVSE